ncbi:MAG: DUF2339 domain-containing protein [Chloroflexota bacterium]
MPESFDTASSENEDLLRRVSDLESAVEEIRRMLTQMVVPGSQGREMPPRPDTSLIAENLNAPQVFEEPPTSIPVPPNYNVQTSPIGSLASVNPADTVPYGPEQTGDRSAKTPTRPPQPFSATVIRMVEAWMPKIGIVVFLFGIVFLYKYATDRGWLNDQVRVGFGLFLGTVLIVAGLSVDKARRFAAVLLGGGIATYYITSYAAYNLFPSLHIPFQEVFGFVALVTAAAFLLALFNNEAILSVVGVAGGLLTPLALNQPKIELGVIVVYACLVTAGAMSIYLVRGWRVLLWVAVPCAWLVFIFCFGSSAGSEGLNLNRLILQGGALFLTLAFWALPVLREVLTCVNPERWPTAPNPMANYLGIAWFMKNQTLLLTLTIPAGTFLYSVAIWPGANFEAWGALALGVSVLFAGVYFALRPYPLDSGVLAYAHAIVSVGFLTLGISWILHENTLLLALTLEAAALQLLARRVTDRGMAICGNVVFGIVATWLASRTLTGSIPENPVWNANALTSLATIAIAFAVSFISRERNEALVLRNSAHLAVTVWLWHELIGLPHGENYVLLAWAFYATLLHGLSLFIDKKQPAWAAHALYILTGALLLVQIVIGLILINEDRTPIFTVQGLTSLGVVVLGAATYWLVWKRGNPPQVQFAYALWLHIALLGWIWQEIGLIPGGNGNAYVSIVWGVYAVCLVVVGLSFGRNARLLTFGVLTLFALVAKLFLIDLQYVDTAWRILLFLGFGGFFLIFSYLFQNKIGRKREYGREDGDGDDFDGSGSELS